MGLVVKPGVGGMNLKAMCEMLNACKGASFIFKKAKVLKAEKKYSWSEKAKVTATIRVQEGGYVHTFEVEADEIDIAAPMI